MYDRGVMVCGQHTCIHHRYTYGYMECTGWCVKTYARTSWKYTYLDADYKSEKLAYILEKYNNLKKKTGGQSDQYLRFRILSQL